MNRSNHLALSLGLLLSLCLLSLLPARAASAAETDDGAPLVYAAASLTDVLQQVGSDYERDRQKHVRFSFGSTATLARQIESGAAADLFISADEEWMGYVAQRGLVRPGSRVDLLGNRLVLIAPADSRTAVTLAPGVSLAAALGAQGKLALADPASVPAGKYAKAALIRLGAWPELASRYVAAENVRMALLFVARGEAPLGVVYRTDAMVEPKVRIVAEFPADTHPPIVYPAALTTRSRAGADGFLEYLAGPAARARFVAAGFSVLGDARSQ
ncbi:MAG: molybdate ABC transporter substrate-binding protein [Steroidobacteraceae bacterium]